MRACPAAAHAAITIPVSGASNLDGALATVVSNPNTDYIIELRETSLGSLIGLRTIPSNCTLNIDTPGNGTVIFKNLVNNGRINIQGKVHIDVGPLTNNGTIKIDSSCSLWSISSGTINNKGTIVNNGGLVLAQPLQNTGTIYGSGLITGINPGSLTSIVLDAGGGVFPQGGSTITIMDNVPMDLSRFTPTLTNKVFKGWEDQSGTVVSGSYTPTGNEPLKAIWEDSATSTPINAGTGDPTFIPTAPERPSKPTGHAIVVGVSEWANVRGGPGEGYEVVDQILLGTPILVGDWSEDLAWAYIYYGNDAYTGWLWGDFVGW